MPVLGSGQRDVSGGVPKGESDSAPIDELIEPKGEKLCPAGSRLFGPRNTFDDFLRFFHLALEWR